MLVTDAHFVKETTTTTGSLAGGAAVLILAGAESGFESFASRVGVNNECIATLRHNAAWMVFRGLVLAADSLQVLQTLDSSDSGNPLVLGTGTKQVYIAMVPALARANDRKNAIMNGEFTLWQRGASFAAIANGYCADRWYYGKAGDMVHTVAQSTDVPTIAQAGRLFNYSMLLDCTTIDGAIAIGDYVLLAQIIEGYNFIPLAQRPTALSFWVKSTKPGTYCISFTNAGADRSYVSEFAVATTWERRVIAIPASPSAGTWNYTNGNGLSIRFCLVAGSTYHAAAGSWVTGNFLSTNNQVNGVDNVANNFWITGVQYEYGNSATPFEYRTVQEELALCKRYYQKSYNLTVNPGTSGSPAGFIGGGLTTLNSAAHTVRLWAQLPVTMRTTPFVTIYDLAGTSGRCNLPDTTANVVAAAMSQSENSFQVEATRGAAGTDARMYFHYTAAAEI